MTLRAFVERLKVLVALGFIGAVCVGGSLAGLPWLASLLLSIPRSITRALALGFLWTMLAGCVAMALSGVVGIPLLMQRLAQARRRGESRPLAARALLLCVSLFLAVAMMEVGATVWHAWRRKIPDPPIQFLETKPAPEIYLVVVGESSARGEPYAPWLSIGQILGWQLERALPGKQVRVDVLASGGICLENALLRLYKLKRRPDAILLCAGHNEFQARYGWSRNVRHYPEEKPRPDRPLLLKWAKRFSGLGEVILEAIDRQYVDAPPDHASRELVDHPTCTPEEWAYLRYDFHRRVEAEVSYCDRIGAIPILVVPPANESGFEPSRSVLPGTMDKAARDAFAGEFQAARALEKSDPAQGISAYRSLVQRQPGFAETHFRLARLLEQAGKNSEALTHYQHARDLDAMPMRCPPDFLEAYYNAAKRHNSVVLVDGAPVLRKLTDHGVLSDHEFHDAQHPTLAGYVALTQNLLEQLYSRGLFGLPRQGPVAVIDPQECAQHFGMNTDKWLAVCDRSVDFYLRSSTMRHDPTERGEKAARYAKASAAIAGGKPVESLGVPGLGLPQESRVKAELPAKAPVHAGSG
jgi:hypothetical protein